MPQRTHLPWDRLKVVAVNDLIQTDTFQPSESDRMDNLTSSSTYLLREQYSVRIMSFGLVHAPINRTMFGCLSFRNSATSPV